MVCKEIETVRAAVKPEGRGKPRGPTSEITILEYARPPRPSSVKPVNDGAGSQKDGGRHPDLAHGDVEAPMHAIGEIDVKVARGAEHDGVAHGTPAVGVRSGVVGTPVRLDFGEPDRDA